MIKSLNGRIKVDMHIEKIKNIYQKKKSSKQAKWKEDGSFRTKC